MAVTSTLAVTRVYTAVVDIVLLYWRTGTYIFSICTQVGGGYWALCMLTYRRTAGNALCARCLPTAPAGGNPLYVNTVL